MGIPTRYLGWSRATFLAALKLHDVAVIPVARTPYTDCKSNNRLLLALQCGLAVCASRIPSYAEFADVCELDNWEAGLEAYLRSPARRQQHVARAQQMIQAHWTPEASSRRPVAAVAAKGGGNRTRCPAGPHGAARHGRAFGTAAHRSAALIDRSAVAVFTEHYNATYVINFTAPFADVAGAGRAGLGFAMTADEVTALDRPALQARLDEACARHGLRLAVLSRVAGAAAERVCANISRAAAFPCACTGTTGCLARRRRWARNTRRCMTPPSAPGCRN